MSERGERPRTRWTGRAIRDRIAQVGEGYAFHIFISYARHPDARRAVLLRRRLEGIGRRWWEWRQMRVFLDTASLRASASLRNEIRASLRESAGLVLLAGPASAASRWCAEEIETWWQTGRGAPLIARTDGTIAWDDEADDFDWSATTALGRASFSGRLTDMPLWTDLEPRGRGLRARREDRRRIAAAAVTLAAAVLEIDPDHLAGQERRRQRRQLQLAAAAVVATIAMGIAALVYATAADRAESRAAAERQNRIAEQLAGSAEAAGERVDMSLLLHAAAYRAAPDRQSAVLWQKAAQFSGLRRVLLMPDGPEPRGVGAVTFSPDGRWLAAASSLPGGDGETPKGTVLIWPGSGGGRAVAVRVPGVAATAVAFDSAGKTLAVGGPTGVVTLLPVPVDGSWATTAPSATLAAPADLRLDQREVEGISIAPDGRIAVSHLGGTVRIWEHGVVTATVPGRRAVFSPDGSTLASIGPAGHITIRNGQTLTAVSSIAVPDPVELAYRDGGRRIAVAVGSGTAGLWIADLSTGRAQAVPGILPGLSVAVASSGIIVTDTATVTSGALTPRPVVQRRLLAISARSVAFRPGGSAYAIAGHWLDSSLAGSVTLWDATAAGIPPVTGIGPVISDDGTVSVVSAVTGEPAGPHLAAGVRSPESVAVSPDASVLAAVRDGRVTAWTLADGSARDIALGGGPDRTERPSRLSFRPDGRLAVIRPDGTVALLDPRSGAVVASIDPGQPAADVSFSADGRLLAVATPAGTQVWLGDGSRLTRQLPSPGAPVTSAAFAGTGTVVVTDGTSLVRWDLDPDRSTVFASPAPGSATITRLAADSRAGLVAGVTDGGTIALWELGSGRRTDTTLYAPVPTEMVGFDANGLTLVASGPSIARWNLDPRHILEWICAVAQRDLDPAQWQVYGTGPQPTICASPSPG